MSKNRESKSIDGHRLTEFIYGTVTALVAVAGIDAEHVSRWDSAVLVVVIGGVAIWLAHAYSTLMSNRITSGHRIEGRDIGHALQSSWPIVTAAALVSLPLFVAALSLYDMRTALYLANVVGVLILAFVGFAAGAITKESWPRRIALALLSSGLGLLIVAVELVNHH